MIRGQYQVFVYGTLLVGESNHHVAKPYLQHVEEGTIRGHLYSVGAYPAVVLDQDGIDIKGEWFTVSAEGLERMDWLEEYQENRSENYYDRVWVKDCYKDQEGFVYVFTKAKAENLHPIKSGSLREFRLNKKVMERKRM